MESEHHTVSFPLRGFVTRRQNGNKIRSLGSFLATTTINLTKPNEIKTENNSSNSNFNDSFSLITQVIKSALFENQTDSRRFKPFSEVSSLISQLYEKFLQQNGSTIRINWLENHSNLVELVQENIPLIFSNLVKPSTTNNVTTFLVDVSLFLNSEENLRFTDDNLFLISLLYRLSFFRGIASYLNFSDKVSFEITLSLLNEKFYLNKLTPEIEQSIIKSPLRLKLAQFLDSNSSLHQLDHDQSLSHCLRKIEDSYKTLPQNIYFKNVFELEEHYLIEKDLNVREAIRDCLIECDRQVVLLIKQMDISLPYNRQEFQKCMIHGDIKVRRDLCFQLIRNFDRKLELKNIDSVVSRLRQSAKYTINQPRLVVGRESRAFGNQAYLFANSKLIQVDSRVLEQTKKLEFVSSMQNLKNLLTIHVREKLTLNYELTNLLAQFESKFENFLHELVPSLGRLLSLVYNLSKSSSFTQYNGVFQNLREALEIFARKSASEVEKQRKNFIENDSLTRLNGVSSVLLQHRKKQDNLAFFSSVLNALTELSGKSGQIEHSIQTIEELVYSLYSSKSGSTRAAFCVLLQRPSYTGADRFKSNELESKPEQEEALQKLVRTGGDHLYMSPSYEWISDATDLIEAVPLFIYERTIINDGKPTTVFEVDQEGLEQTVRQIAEFWAQNIERTIESEHICLARSFLIRLTPQFDILAKQIQNLNSVCLKDESNKNYQSINKEICDLLTLEAQVYTGKISKSELSKNIARLAQLISVKYNELAVEVEKVVEKAWSSQDFITRIEALERILLEKNQVNLDLLKEADKLETNREIERLSLKAFDRQRPLPAFHLLTTEAPGLIEGFITVVLEEEMAMRNVIKAHQLDDQVKEFSSRIQANLAQLAEKVIEEFGYEPIVSQHISNGSSKEQAVLRVMSENIPIQEQVASLAILTQMFHFEAKSDNELVSLAYLKLDQSTLESAEKYWSNQVGLDLKSINNEAIKQVYERNKTEPDFIEGLKKLSPDSFDTSLEVISQDVLIQFLLNDLIYSKEVQVATQWLMRAKSFDYTASKYNELHLKERAKCFIREHTALVQTTSRRLAISNNNLHNELCDPRYAFSSGVTFESTLTSLSPNSSHLSSCTSALPTGLRKRYHLIYGPSRVNLGKDERRSVENWSQFIGVSDPLAAKHAQDVYELINYSPVVRNVREAENLKVSENQWTALVRSCRNVQAFFVERLGVGDIEDLSYQFNQRGGINLGSLKEGEGYNSGPTAGYCIPKDLLFKLFVGTHQDARKLLQIGVPRFLHKYLLALMAEVYSRRNEFETVGEWELWAAEQFLNKDELSKRFASLDNTNREYVPAQISGYLQRFIALSGSQIVFHLAKLIQVLGNTGVPSPLLNTGRDLHSVLWSNWSDHKITLGGEQVNRSTVFTMTREIPESAKRSRLLNPNAGIVEEDSLRIQMFGVYKGDDDEPPPPDVRYSWTMRAFQILSGHYQAVADSLDLEGQVIARLSWVGFKPDSKDPRDIETTSYLLKKFNQENNPPQQMNEFTQRLKKAFPCHSTVGDITITAVPGVDSEDLLGFSAETLTLLGDEADRARQILESQGKMSIDQMKANATLRRKFPEEWTPLNQLSYSEQQRIKNLVGESIHPLVLRLRGPGTNFITDLQGQDVVVFSITHPEILKLNPAHLRDLMLVGRPNSALCALDFVAQGRHRCWYERDVMLWYAAARSLTLSGKLQFDWSKRNHFGRQSVYKAFGTGTDQYSPALGTDVRSEVVRQERRAIEIWNSANNLIKVFTTTSSLNEKLRSKLNEEALEQYQQVLINHLSNNTLANEVLHYQQYSQRLLMAKRFKSRDQIIQESIQFLFTTLSHQLADEFNTIHWLSIGGIFLINGSTEQHQSETLNTIRTANQIVKLIKSNLFELSIVEKDLKELNLISKLIVSELSTTRMTLGERKGEMFSVKASEDCAIRAVARRAQLAIQSNMQKAISYRLRGFEHLATSDLKLEKIVEEVQKLMIGLSETPQNSTFSVENVNETFGQIIKYTTNALEATIEKFFTQEHLSEKENQLLKVNMKNSASDLFKNGTVDLKIVDSFCGTYEDHGYLAKLLEISGAGDHRDNLKLSEPTEEILKVCELLYYLLALEKTSSFLTQRYSSETSSDIWRKLSEFFAKTIDDHFYEYNPWILDCKRGSAFVHFYDDLGIIKSDYNSLLYETSWRHHRILYKYLNNLIQNHSDLYLRVANQQERSLLLGVVELGDEEENDQVLKTAIGNHGVGEENSHKRNYEALWRAYNQLREISFMKNDGIEFPVVFSSYDSTFLEGLNTSNRVNLAILSPVGRTHYSRAIMESSFLNDNVFITRTGYFSNDGKTKTNKVSRDKSYLFIEDAHFFLSRQQYYASLKLQYNLTDEEANSRISLDEKLGRFTGKGIRVAAKFSEPILIGCCIAHHHHPLETGLTIAGYPSTDKSPFLFDLTYNKSLYPLIYSEDALLPPQIDWLQEETSSILDEQLKTGKTQLQTENIVIQSIKTRLRPFALEHGIIIAKGSAESGARNLSRFDIKNLNLTSSGGQLNSLINEDVLHEAAKFIYEVSKGQNVTIQKAIVSTPLSWMSQYAVKKFIERQIIEHSVSVNIEKYPKDFIYGTLRVILSSGVPDSNNLDDPSNWEASHLLSLSSLQTATNVGRQGTLEMLAPEMIHSKFRNKFLEKLADTGKKAMSLTSKFGPTYWNDEINLDGSGESYKQKETKSTNSQNRILPFRNRRPEIPEKDACGVPYWWPRYLMLDIISEPVFVDQHGKQISNAHIIDISVKESKDGDDQPIFTVCDKYGNFVEAKIIDFIFWLLEPNVGIGLWPNYWKRELVRNQEHSTQVDYQQVGISDRIVLKNFLKAGHKFLKVKFETNDLSLKLAVKRYNSFKLSQELNAPSDVASLLWESLTNVVQTHGFTSIGTNQVSLWLSEMIRKKISNFTSETLVLSLDLLTSVSLDDLLYCKQKSQNFNPRLDIDETVVLSWLRNEKYRTRVCESAIDSLLSVSLAPLVEILPNKLSSESKLLQNSKTFAVISQKTTLLTHQIYPFILGKGDFLLNVVGIHSDWILPKSNLAKRAIIYDSQSNSFVETDFESPLALNYGFIVELFKDEEVSTHKKLSKEYETAGLILLNSAGVSQSRADDKMWIRKNLSPHLTPNHLFLSRDQLQNEVELEILNELIKNSPRGVVLQPSSNTTESHLVIYFNKESASKIIEKSREITNLVNDTHGVLVSEFRGNVLFKNSPVVFRFNVALSKHVTVAAYIGRPDNKIVGLKGTYSQNSGYCERLDQVLSNLHEETTNKKVEFNSTNWNILLNTARQVAQIVDLPLVGIDILLESNEYTIKPIVLEINARPGTLIFGEQLIFDETGTQISHSLMSPPVNEDFWNYVLSINSSVFNEKNMPKNLLQWRHFLASEQVTKAAKNIFHVNKFFELNPVNSNNKHSNSLLSLLGQRYGTSDPNLIIDRINSISRTIDDAILNGFDLTRPVSLIFSNGRDRYFGGHTDLLGLGGPTINATTENEIIALIQQSTDSLIQVTNSNPEYISARIEYDELMIVLKQVESESFRLGDVIWDPNEWTSYIKGNLAYMLSRDFSAKNKVKSKLFGENVWVGFRVHFNSSGRLHLQSRIGSSSSSALTSAFVLGLNSIFDMQLTTTELSQTDYGEFYLGKTAGCADKTTILNAIKGELIAVSSIPEKFIRSISLPNNIVVIMVNSNIPRLNSSYAKEFLLKAYPNDKVESIHKWAQSIMRRFGSFVFAYSVDLLVQRLSDEAIFKQAGISSDEARILLESLCVDNPEAGFTTSKTLLNSRSKYLLRELCWGGKLEKKFGFDFRFKRYNLIFRLLKLLPETENVTIAGNEEIINARKAVLYGISETERCYEYVALMNSLNSSQITTCPPSHLLNLVRWSHNGDRAVVDYRNDFKQTPWAKDRLNLVSDEILDKWIANPREGLTDKSGGFERSLPEFDEWATSIDEKFNKQAALRVSAAGLGGTVCVHSLSSIASDVIAWLKKKGLVARVVRPGPSCLVTF